MEQLYKGRGDHMDTLVHEKVKQAAALLRQADVDVWLIFTQETGFEVDPVYSLLMGDRDIGGGILLLTKEGQATAIVGGLDQMIPLSTGVWTDVRVHQRNVPELLRERLDQIHPRTIAINYAKDNVAADGLTYGKYLRLIDMLQGTPYVDRLVSAEGMAQKLRAVKTPGEIDRIRQAIAKADIVFDRLRNHLQPGQSGLELFAFVQEQIAQVGAACGWSRYNCPIMTMGPVDFMGHTPPTDRRLEKGWLLQVDLGLRYDGYCSDFRRMFYLLQDGEDTPPAKVTALFELIHGGISAMIQGIAPGNPHDAPSASAFRRITAAGFLEPKFSGGHQLGRAVHDGGIGLLNYNYPNPDAHMEIGNVFTVEGLETRLEGYGWMSLEEDVVVTADGCEVLTNRQNELYTIRSR